MAIYDRMMGLAESKIPVHQFMGAVQEVVLGNMSVVQAATAFELSAAEQTEAGALRDRILQEPAGSGATAGVPRRLKAMEFERVLMMAEVGIAPFNTVAAVKARLGVS